ncbi:head-tail connector protein [Enterobacter phage SDFMU_Pec]|uniref:Head-tail connector protein n=1 Tax=Enterobacter phage SDFMU_Pec TaxID=3076136 RepID=A0AA96R0U8_9CAUD|nr:head-tail connector protein [Enterobacter phage SDFMU_Pec]
MRGTKEPLAGLFTKLQDSSCLTAAEQFAEWSLPTVFTKDLSGMDGKRSALHRDYQSLGAILINTASTKVVKSLFPQGAPFFRFVDSDELAGVVGELGIQGEVPSVQAEIELAASAQVYKDEEYAAKLHATKLLMVTGNALEYRDKQRQRSHIYSIRDYAVKRNGSGDVMLIVLKERICVGDLPDEYRIQYDNKADYEDLELYTGICREVREGGAVVYKVYQEVDNKPVGKPSYYPEKQCPYTVLVWNRVNSEHYGRGLVEDYAGEFARLSELSKALTLYEVEAMRFVNMSNSASGVDIDAFNEAAVGDIIQTNAPAGTTGPGVWAYEGGVYQKIQVMQAEIASIEQRLARAFMYGGNTRDAERVTAYEIRQNAQEAQEALGDAYSQLSSVWLTKLAYLYCLELYPQMQPLLDLQAMTLNVVVGTAALAKAAQNDRLLEATQSLQLIAPVLSQLTKRTNMDALIDTVFDSFGINSSKFFYTEEQLKQLQEQEDTRAAQAAQQQQQALQAADPNQAAQQLGLIA